MFPEKGMRLGEFFEAIFEANPYWFPNNVSPRWREHLARANQSPFINLHLFQISPDSNHNNF